jgi:hypothetical protein
VAIDLNDKIKMWGGFTAQEFWVGAGTLLCLFMSCIIGVSIHFRDFKLGLGIFCALAGPWMAFMIYQRELPKGYLLRRMQQEGRFLIFHFPFFKGQNLYSSLPERRGDEFEREWGSKND